MNNTCFVIMPQEEPSGYSQGHFNRVYDYVIIPACRAAGYWPTRADKGTYDNPLAVVKEIIDSDVALFDLSGNNTNALYGMAVRQSLALPVVIAKDAKSVINFSAGDFNLIDYDDSLRIDTVQKAIEDLSTALKEAVENKKSRHELLDRLSIALPPAPVQFTETTLSFTNNEDQREQQEEAPQENRLPIISPLPDYVGEPFTDAQILKLKTGDILFHLIYGDGKVNFVKKMGKDDVASVQFESGSKLLVLVASDLFRKINN